MVYVERKSFKNGSASGNCISSLLDTGTVSKLLGVQVGIL